MVFEILKPVDEDYKTRLTFQVAGSNIVILWFFGRGSYFLMFFIVYICSDQTPKLEICLCTQIRNVKVTTVS